MENLADLLLYSFIVEEHLYIDDVFKEIFHIVPNIGQAELNRCLESCRYGLITKSGDVFYFSDYCDSPKSFADLGIYGSELVRLIEKQPS